MQYKTNNVKILQSASLDLCILLKHTSLKENKFTRNMEDILLNRYSV